MESRHTSRVFTCLSILSESDLKRAQLQRMGQESGPSIWKDRSATLYDAPHTEDKEPIRNTFNRSFYKALSTPTLRYGVGNSEQTWDASDRHWPRRSRLDTRCGICQPSRSCRLLIPPRRIFVRISVVKTRPSEGKGSVSTIS